MALVVLVLAAFVAIAASLSPPIFPSEFEARITLVENGRAAEADWFWSATTQQDRTDFRDSEGVHTEIRNFAEGTGYVIFTPDSGSPSCRTEKIGAQPTFNFSEFSYQGQKEFYHKWVDVWTFKDPATLTIAEYLDDAGSTEPVQLGQKDVNGTYEGVFFNRFHRGPVPAMMFNVSKLFPGQCSASAKPRSYVRLPNLTWKSHNLTAHGNAAVTVAWADDNWNCGDIDCTYRVPAGSAQSGYGCAEFVSRSLCAGGYIQGVTPTSPQAAYGSYYSGGRGPWDLLWVSSLGGGPLGLGDLLTAAGWYQSKGCDSAYAIIVLDYAHFVIGAGPGIVDAHNNARYHNGIAGYGPVTMSFNY